MNEYVFLSILIMSIAIITLISILVSEKKKHAKRLAYHQNEQMKLNKKCSIYEKENIHLKEMLNKYEEEEYERLGCYKTANGDLKKNPIYEGKRALIGDYMLSSYNNTKKVLQSLGFIVDIEKRKDDVIDRISYGNNYDIIFTNNVYHDGTGPELLKELRSYEGFSTPIVIHTVSKNQKEYFVDNLGFNGYIEKPVTPEKLIPILQQIFKD